MGETAEALPNLHQALILAHETEAKALEAIILSNLMRGHKTINPSAAIFYGKQCVNNYQELRAAINGLDKTTRQTYLKTIEEQYRFLADLLIENGQFAEAQKVLEMLKEEEFAKFVRRDADEIKMLSRRVVLNQKEKFCFKNIRF